MNEELLETASPQIPPYIIPLLLKTPAGDVKYNAVYPTPFISLGYALKDYKGNWTPPLFLPPVTPGTWSWRGLPTYIVAFLILLLAVTVTEPYCRYKRWQEDRYDKKLGRTKWRVF